MTEAELAEVLNRNPEIAVNDDSGAFTARSSTNDTGAPSPLEVKFAQLWAFCEGPKLESEYRFEPSRRWRADFAHMPSRTIIEIEGGLYGNGRHQRIGGYQADCEKYNWATMLGWRVIRLTSQMLTLDYVVSLIEWMEVGE